MARPGTSGIPLPKLPSVERAQFVVDAWRDGQTVLEITKGLSGWNNTVIREFVERVVADVDNHDTYLDDVAVQRAYEGDKDAWAALTHYERRECVYRIISRASLNKTHLRWPLLPVLTTAGPGGVLGWLAEWAMAIGEDPHRFQQLLERRRQRGTAA
jgi:hypothetical protein